MRILFEEHQYEASVVKDVLSEISVLQDVDKKVSVSYVGYFYNSKINDCVFILPKVLLEDSLLNGKKHDVIANVNYKDNNDVEHEVVPENIINPEGQEKYLTKEYRKFIFEFSVWIYRALSVYKKNNPNSKALYYKSLPQEGYGKKHRAETFLDIVLSLVRFNQENQNYFMFTIKNIHSGLNKINWSRTISKSAVVIQGDVPLYLDPVNKKRQVNYEEELFIIFFSILNYLNSKYGFKTPINCQYPLITGKGFDNYLKGFGKSRLRQIKYKYFSDKALQLWDICYAFFDTTHKIAINVANKEYLLAKKFEVVFEAMIDELIGTRREDIPRGLKDQDDGKRIDHLYTYQSLTSDDEGEEIYYIGDSKYYKSGNSLGKESIYKQYTYARNVIQWNIDLFMNEEDLDKSDWSDEDKADYAADKQNDRFKKIRLRDDHKDNFTEGYNVIPNFFLSAYVDKDRTYVKQENIQPHKQKGQKDNTRVSYQFKNRLFDRDTLILSHYDVNFLYVVYLYARERSSEKQAWRSYVRKKFRDEIRNVIEREFNFYALKALNNIDAKEYIKDNFKDLIGKVYTPYTNTEYLSLALSTEDQFKEANDKTIEELKKVFYVKQLDKLGEDPERKIQEEIAEHGNDYHNETWDGKYAIVIDDRNGKLSELLQTEDGFKCYFSFEKDLHLLSDIMKAKYAVIKDINGDISVFDMPVPPELRKQSDLILYSPLQDNGSLFGYTAESVKNENLELEFQLSITNPLKNPVIDNNKLSAIIKGYMKADTYLPQCVDLKEIVVR